MKSRNLEISKESIAIRAYEIYLSDGCRDGHAEEHWFRAEAELKSACLPTELALVESPTIQIMQTKRKGATTTRKKTATAGPAQVGIQKEKGLESKPAPI